MVTSTSRRTRSNKKSTRPASGRKAAARHRAAASKASSAKAKWVYRFGNGKAEGRADMRNLLGGKGAGLAEMANLGLPVPPGFTITTAVCSHYYENGKTYPKDLEKQVDAGHDGHGAQSRPQRRHRRGAGEEIRRSALRL